MQVNKQIVATWQRARRPIETQTPRPATHGGANSAWRSAARLGDLILRHLLLRTAHGEARCTLRRTAPGAAGWTARGACGTTRPHAANQGRAPAARLDMRRSARSQPSTTCDVSHDRSPSPRAAFGMLAIRYRMRCPTQTACKPMLRILLISHRKPGRRLLCVPDLQTKGEKGVGGCLSKGLRSWILRKNFIYYRDISTLEQNALQNAVNQANLELLVQYSEKISNSLPSPTDKTKQISISVIYQKLFVNL